MNKRWSYHNPKRPVAFPKIHVDLGKYLEERGKDDRFDINKCLQLQCTQKPRVKENIFPFLNLFGIIDKREVIQLKEMVSVT